MKKGITAIVLLSIIIGIGVFHKEIVSFLMKNVIYKREIIIQDHNQYSLGNSYSFIQETDNFKPTSKQDLKNIIYTHLDRGWDSFSFYCDEDIYKDCTNDMKALANDSNTLSNINNFVHPFNSYDKLYITINNFGKITLETKKLYSLEEQLLLNIEVEVILKTELKEDMSDYDKIKVIHDYIINHSIYDEERAQAIKNNENLDSREPSHKAIGPLTKGKALCSGYSDAMALFLSRLGIKNYKISSESHVWNLVFLNGNWYHLDLTWDDPVVTTHENLLLHDFFLITTDKLAQIDLTQHQFDKTIYVEAS